MGTCVKVSVHLNIGKNLNGCTEQSPIVISEEESEQRRARKTYVSLVLYKLLNF